MLAQTLFDHFMLHIQLVVPRDVHGVQVHLYVAAFYVYVNKPVQLFLLFTLTSLHVKAWKVTLTFIRNCCPSDVSTIICSLNCGVMKFLASARTRVAINTQPKMLTTW
jgi:hypothetical protein